jgi:cytochrome c oxidase subunit 1
MQAEASHGGIHMPDQSWFPLFAAMGVLTGGLGFAFSYLPVAFIGLGILMASAYMWALEGPGGYHIHLDTDGHAAEDHGTH